MKNTLLSFGMIGMTGILLSSFAFMQNGDTTQEQKKTRQSKTENGKKMETDTEQTGDDFFILNGDTIYPARLINKLNASGNATVDQKNGKEKAMNMFPAPPSPPSPQSLQSLPTPPSPPKPPTQSVQNMKAQQKDQSINLNDPNIVSFKKQDLEGGLEKIEIIRKKSDGVDTLNVKSELIDESALPEPPKAPQFNMR